jgi:Fe2+ or Zn2+ uptake regulation protein
VRCSVCGVLADVDVPTALFAQHVAAEQSGFDVHGHQTVFLGVCPVCRAAAGHAPRGAH